jgi:hypothetical protein
VVIQLMQVLKLPDVLMGELGNDPAKKTLLVYGHLDVQPANEKEDGWGPALHCTALHRTAPHCTVGGTRTPGS